MNEPFFPYHLPVRPPTSPWDRHTKTEKLMMTLIDKRNSFDYDSKHLNHKLFPGLSLLGPQLEE